MKDRSTTTPRRTSRGADLAAAGWSLFVVALLTACALVLRINAVSAGFVLLVGVLIIASRQRLVVGTAAAIAATTSYNFFFFEPKYTLKIADPEDWIALASFLLTSLLANRLLERERRQAERARQFALERERFLEERAHVEALREANELKTSLLQAVSHDLKSPLTVLGVESEALERGGTGHPAAATHVRAIRDQVARLHRRIDNLLSVARFEAGIVTPRIEPTPAADLLRAARESLPTIAVTRTIQTSVDGDTPDLLVDPSLALEIVVNLIENAHQSSPPQARIELDAAASPLAGDRVWVEVRDRGPGMTTPAPDAHGGGLGIEIARTLAALSGGTVEWLRRPGGGTIARLDVPAVHA